MLTFTGTYKQRTGGFGAVRWDVYSHLHLQTKDAHIQGWGGVYVSFLSSSPLFSSLLSSSQLSSAQVSAFLNSRASQLLLVLVYIRSVSLRGSAVYIQSVSLTGTGCTCDPKRVQRMT